MSIAGKCDKMAATNKQRVGEAPKLSDSPMRAGPAVTNSKKRNKPNPTNKAVAESSASPATAGIRDEEDKGCSNSHSWVIQPRKGRHQQRGGGQRKRKHAADEVETNVVMEKEGW